MTFVRLHKKIIIKCLSLNYIFLIIWWAQIDNSFLKVDKKSRKVLWMCNSQRDTVFLGWAQGYELEPVAKKFSVLSKKKQHITQKDTLLWACWKEYKMYDQQNFKTMNCCFKPPTVLQVCSLISSKLICWYCSNFNSCEFGQRKSLLYES